MCEVAAATGRSKSWVHRHVSLYRAGGDAAIVPRRRCPKERAQSDRPAIEDLIVSWRKHLVDEGYDAGAATFRWHLRLGRWKYLAAFPVMVALAAMRRQPQN